MRSFGNVPGAASLVRQLVYRDVVGRYKGSVGGVLWAVLNPLLMLIVYTFVFSVVFNARWSGSVEALGNLDFAINLFCGLLVFNVWSESLNRSTTLISAQTNLVKRVVFPLDLLALVPVGTALVSAMIGFVLLATVLIYKLHFLHWTMVFAPLVMLPCVLITLACVWFISSISVYLKDIQQVVLLLTTAVMFLSPLFFPIEAIPEKYRPILAFNPLGILIGEMRKVIVRGELPDFRVLAELTVAALVACWLARSWFQQARKGFSDIL